MYQIYLKYFILHNWLNENTLWVVYRHHGLMAWFEDTSTILFWELLLARLLLLLAPLKGLILFFFFSKCPLQFRWIKYIKKLWFCCVFIFSSPLPHKIIMILLYSSIQGITILIIYHPKHNNTIMIWLLSWLCCYIFA